VDSFLTAHQHIKGHPVPERLSKKVKVVYSCSWNSISQLRSVTCHMGSHSTTCHPSQVNHNHTGQYSIYLPRRDGRLSWP